MARHHQACFHSLVSALQTGTRQYCIFWFYLLQKSYSATTCVMLSVHNDPWITTYQMPPVIMCIPASMCVPVLHLPLSQRNKAALFLSKLYRTLPLRWKSGQPPQCCLMGTRAASVSYFSKIRWKYSSCWYFQLGS